MQFMPIWRIAALFPSVRISAVGVVPAALFPFNALAAAPVVATSGGSAAFVAGDNAPSMPVTDDGGLFVSDPDSATLATATATATATAMQGSSSQLPR